MSELICIIGRISTSIGDKQQSKVADLGKYVHLPEVGTFQVSISVHLRLWRLTMNTAQIAYALEQDPKTSKTFCGVFPSDKLPQTIDKYPCGLVANTDPRTRPGAHWVSILMTSRQNAEWFGSIQTENPPNSTDPPSQNS